MTRMEKTLAKIDTERITADLENKIAEIFIEWQTNLLIESGDIDPMQSYQLDELTAKTASLMARILTNQAKQEKEN